MEVHPNRNKTHFIRNGLKKRGISFKHAFQNSMMSWEPKTRRQNQKKAKKKTNVGGTDLKNKTQRININSDRRCPEQADPISAYVVNLDRKYSKLCRVCLCLRLFFMPDGHRTDSIQCHRCSLLTIEQNRPTKTIFRDFPIVLLAALCRTGTGW